MSKLVKEEKNMTKSKSILAAVVISLFVLATCLLGLAGCASATVEYIVIDSGFATDVKINSAQTYDTTNLVVKAKMSDGSDKTLASDEYTIAETPVISTLGKKSLVVQYKSGDNTLSARADVYVYGDLKSIEIDETTVPQTVDKAATFSTDGIVVNGMYECEPAQDRAIVLQASDGLTFNTIDTSEVGFATLTAACGGFTDSVDIEVKKDYSIWAFNAPANIAATYAANSTRNNTYTTTGSTGVKGFNEIERHYVVGSYNKFYYQPTLQVSYTGSTDTANITDFPMTAKVYQLNNTTHTFTELTGSAYNAMVSFDRDEHWFQFTSQANGESFKIEVFPAATLDASDADDIQPLTFEFDVIDGFNIYNAADLSAIDNYNAEGKWTTLKAQWMQQGITNGDITNVNTDTFILHNNITITRDDIPSSHFWTDAEVATATDAAQAAGSLKDENDPNEATGSVYNRQIVSGSADGSSLGGQFKLEGNYFTISAQDLPLIHRENDNVRDPSKGITVHSTLFAVVGADPLTVEQVNALVGDDKTYSTFEAAADKLAAQALFTNVHFLGNTQKTDNALQSGGIICIKSEYVDTTFENCLSEKWYISGFTTRATIAYNRAGYLPFIVQGTNMFDAYNSMLYSWGGTLIINQSCLIGAGGPLMISDHTYEKDWYGSPSDVVIDEESVLESYVAGSEGWFDTYQAASALIGTIKAQNAIFKANGKTVALRTSGGAELINIVAVLKAGSAQDATASPIKGSVTIEGSDTALRLDKDNTYLEILDKVVVSKILEDASAQQVVTGYMASNPSVTSAYVAVKELIAFADATEPEDDAMKPLWQGANVIKNSYNAAVANSETIAQVQYMVTQGVVYVASNGMVCMPGAEGGFALQPNETLWAQANGFVNVYVQGTLGAVLTMGDYTSAPTA